MAVTHAVGGNRRTGFSVITFPRDHHAIDGYTSIHHARSTSPLSSIT
jgi:hypothetical protein